MKISLVNTHDISGGAARAMYRLHSALRESGEDSKIICLNKYSQDIHTKAVQMHRLTHEENLRRKIFSQVQNYIASNRTALSNTLFSFPYPGLDISGHPYILNSDMINLHWVAHFQSPVSIAKLLETKIPVVWTLHDEWAFTGGCHYTSSCRRFMTNCKPCMQIANDQFGFASSVLKDKIELFGKDKITVISPSVWLAKEAKKSALFCDSRIEVIPNSVEIDIFHPIEKSVLRRKFQIPENVFLLSFGAENGNEKRKGFSELISALQICAQNPEWKKAKEKGNVRILLFGNPSLEIEELGIQFHNAGKVEDDRLLAEIYSSADLFILPSLEDNLPNTMLESLACATPVLAFDVGGMKDVLFDRKTGYLAKWNDPKSLSEKILHAWKNTEERILCGKNASEMIQKNYSKKEQARKYMDLFSELSKQNFKKRRNVVFSSFSKIKKPMLRDLSLQMEKLVTELEKEPHFLHSSDIQTKVIEYFRLRNKPEIFTGVIVQNGDGTFNFKPQVKVSVKYFDKKESVEVEIQFLKPVSNTSQILWIPFLEQAGIFSIQSIQSIREKDKRNQIDLVNASTSFLSIRDLHKSLLDLNPIYRIPISPKEKKIIIRGKGRVLDLQEIVNRTSGLLIEKDRWIERLKTSIPFRVGNFFLFPLRKILRK